MNMNYPQYDISQSDYDMIYKSIKNKLQKNHNSITPVLFFLNIYHNIKPLYDYFPRVLCNIIKSYVLDTVSISFSIDTTINFKILHGIESSYIDYTITLQLIKNIIPYYNLVLCDVLLKSNVEHDGIYKKSCCNASPNYACIYNLRTWYVKKMAPLLNKYFLTYKNELFMPILYSMKPIQYVHRTNSAQTRMLRMTIIIYNMVLNMIRSNKKID